PSDHERNLHERGIVIDRPFLNGADILPGLAAAAAVRTRNGRARVEENGRLRRRQGRYVQEFTFFQLLHPQPRAARPVRQLGIATREPHGEISWGGRTSLRDTDSRTRLGAQTERWGVTRPLRHVARQRAHVGCLTYFCFASNSVSSFWNSGRSRSGSRRGS